MAERLRNATIEGRILAQELEDRLASALRARTYGELDALVADIPGDGVAGRPRSRRRQLIRAHPVGAVALLVTITLIVFVVAALLLAVLFAFSGVWIILALLLLTHRHGRYSQRGAFTERRRRAPHSARWVP